MSIEIQTKTRTEWRLHGVLHRDDDLPAVIYANGTRKWCQHGKLHREHDLPAAIFARGDQVWYMHGQKHREGDLPAILFANGDQVWYRHGKKHRDGDLPAIIFANGDRVWYQNGNKHRDKKPAWITETDAHWYNHGAKVPPYLPSQFKWPNVCNLINTAFEAHDVVNDVAHDVLLRVGLLDPTYLDDYMAEYKLDFGQPKDCQPKDCQPKDCQPKDCQPDKYKFAHIHKCKQD